jgi:dienelactone hydrolase
VAALKAQAGRVPVDADKIGAFGFCLGGTTVLELARAGDKLAGIVTLHGDLSAGRRADRRTAGRAPRRVRGSADESVTADAVAAIQQEMNAAGADWQLVNFSGTVHCFALPNVGNDPASNCRYNPRSARRAYRMMDNFFDEVFGR